MDKIRVGFIGAGGIAHLHCRQLLGLPEADITALSDPSRESRDKLVSAFGLTAVKHFADYKEMLGAAELDAVVICSPHTLHFQQATDALNHGLHVLIEKPMTCSSGEAEQLIETAKKAGKLLQVAYQRHTQPAFMYIKQAIEAREIGRLTSVTASLYQDWQQLTNGTWRQNPQLSGGGMLMDTGSHLLDTVLWTTDLTPVEVKAQLHRQGTPVENDSFTSIRFAEGPIAGLNVVGFSPCWHETYVICGEEGAIFYDNWNVTVKRRGQEPVKPQLAERVTNQDKSFIDAILGKCGVLIPGDFALKVIRLTEMIYVAADYQA